jgi:hypothetical protein
MIFWIIGIVVSFVIGYVLGAVIASNGRDEYWIPVTRIHERIKVLKGKNIDPEIMIARIDELKLLLPKED